MDTNPTVSDLFKAKEVFDQEIDAAIVAAFDAVLLELATEADPLEEGVAPDFVETTRARLQVFETLETHERAWKRNMVRTAILLAKPVKG